MNDQRFIRLRDALLTKPEHQRHYYHNPFFHASVDHLIYQLLPALLDGLATSTAEQYDEHQNRIRLLEASPTGVFIPHIDTDPPS